MDMLVFLVVALLTGTIGSFGEFLTGVLNALISGIQGFVT